MNASIAADRDADFTHRCAPELAAPDHQRVVQETASLQVEDERGRSLVDLPTAIVEGLAEVVVGIAVVIPVGVVELHEANAALDHTAREQTVPRERGAIVFDAVERADFGRFTRKIHELGRARLHTERHLVCGDS